MGSKGSISFSTDANVYGRGATSIDVSGNMPFSDGGVVELYGKDNGFYRRIDVNDGEDSTLNSIHMIFQQVYTM